ncbi:AGE family epimerase/isomerase [Caldicellulosiruptoraceae bacterium PP1]
MSNNIVLFRDEIKGEILSILEFWGRYTYDKNLPGFTGFIDNFMNINKNANKGGILNSRILWTFSRAYNIFNDERYISIATHAFNFLKDYLYDSKYKGIYWVVDENLEPLDFNKHIYNQAFAIYALSEYYMATRNKIALDLAYEIFDKIEYNAFDNVNGGYFEFLDRKWNTITYIYGLESLPYMQKKIHNTHLHLLEAYNNFLKATRDTKVEKSLLHLVDILLNKMLRKEIFHFGAFFDSKFNLIDTTISYGHDIESSWLIWETAEIIGDNNLKNSIKDIIIKVADITFEEGIDNEFGGVYSEKYGNVLNDKKVWWVQSEAVIGFLNAFQLTGDRKYFDASINVWNFIKSKVIDNSDGYREWYNELTREGNPLTHMPKVDFWKCPYHNSRMCFEVLNRI